MAFINPITKIIDTLTGIRNNTVGGVAAGALAVKELATQVGPQISVDLGVFPNTDYPTVESLAKYTLNFNYFTFIQ